jgi:Tol biopolymer transport system component
VDRRGTSVVADSTSIDGLVRSMSLSPDGSAVALSMERPTDITGLARIWVTSMGGGPLQLVTTESRSARSPVWSADGRSLFYISDEGTTIYRRRADGSGSEESVATVPRGIVGMTAHPSGGSIVLVGEDSGERRRELLDLQLTGDRALRNLGVPVGVNIEPPALSPDGRWLAYVSPLSGRDEVYVSPYPDVGSGRVQLSGEGGGAPRWSPRGEELFFVNDAGAVVSVRYSTTNGFRAVATTTLFSPQSRGGEGRMLYSPDPAGQRFLMIDIAADRGGSGVSRPVVVQNFTTELRARVP